MSQSCRISRRLRDSYDRFSKTAKLSTYGHSQLKTGHPVRSAIHKQLNGRLVLRWVTTWESLLLYVLLPRECLIVLLRLCLEDILQK
jgi:hypothetical protein